MFTKLGSPAPNPSDDSWKAKVLEKLVFSALTEQRRARRWGIFFRLFFMSYLAVVLFMAVPGNGFNADFAAEPHTAVVRLEGVIESQSRTTNAESIITALRAAFENDNAKGIILKINSPGGSPVQSDEIYSAITELRKEYSDKKIYSVISDAGASGAYYVAAATDEIYANRSSLVGSIGVIHSSFGFVGLMEKLGVERRVQTAGKSKALVDPFSPVTPTGKAFMRELLDDVHAVFITQVEKGRGDKLDADKKELIFSGMAWGGDRAKALGLIDGIANSRYVASELIGEENMVDYSAHESLLERISSKAGVVFSQALESLARVFANQTASASTQL